MDFFSHCILSPDELRGYLNLTMIEIERKLSKEVKDVKDRCAARKQVYTFLFEQKKKLTIKNRNE